MRLASTIATPMVAVLAGAALLLSAGLLAESGPTPSLTDQPSPVVFPRGMSALRFSHAQHTGELRCAQCHRAAATSRQAADRLLPSEDACAPCHEVEVEPGALASAAALCGRCHPEYGKRDAAPRFRPGTEGRRGRWDVQVPPPRTLVPAPYLRFSHAEHLARAASVDADAELDLRERACLRCHAEMVSSRAPASGAARPRMATCLECHDGRRAPDDCTTCHPADGAGRVRWRLPSGLLRPSGAVFDDGHGPGFLTGHGLAAARDSDHCERCHAPESCRDCHGGSLSPKRIHPADWPSTHGVAARKDPRGCDACHRSQSSCIACHRRSHVVSEGAQRIPDDQRFHPAGWADGTGGARHHGPEARRNLRACSACHREETCISCHGSASAPDLGGSGVFANPHGRDFTRRCRAMWSRNSAVCLRCHAASDPQLDRCR